MITELNSPSSSQNLKSEYEYGLDHVGGTRSCESNESPFSMRHVPILKAIGVVERKGSGLRNYGLPLSFLVGYLGGLFFDGMRSCTEDSFAGHSGLYCANFLAVNIFIM